MLIVNSNELNHKEQQKNKNTIATIEEGDDIAAVTFFATKPQKRRRLPFLYNKAIEEGDGSYPFLLLQYNRTIEGKKKRCVESVAQRTQ